MYLSDRDLADAVKLQQLIIDPAPVEYDTTSVDVHLDKIESARVWNVTAFENDQRISGHAPVLPMAFNHKAFSDKYTMPVPSDATQLVFGEGDSVLIKPHGFFLWQTAEIIGTPEENPRHICFINGKSTKARTGLLVHMTAPTIHAGWWGQVTLEISNLGPFTLALRTGDAIAQIIVASLTSFPAKKKNAKGISVGQRKVTGAS